MTERQVEFRARADAEETRLLAERVSLRSSYTIARHSARAGFEEARRAGECSTQRARYCSTRRQSEFAARAGAEVQRQRAGDQSATAEFRERRAKAQARFATAV